MTSCKLEAALAFIQKQTGKPFLEVRGETAMVTLPGHPDPVRMVLDGLVLHPAHGAYELVVHKPGETVSVLIHFSRLISLSY